MNFFGLNILKSKEIRYAARSAKWSKIRKEHLSKNPSCFACGRSSKVEVHHIEPVHINPDKELDPDNLVTLCDSPCHIVFGHFLDYKSWNPRVIEDCMVYYKKYNNRPYKDF
jgi:5-methylcytosine-specific restriction endonuclease McrA